jgi:hypothetical protein
MPQEWRLHVLEGRLEREFGERYAAQSVDLYGLTPVEQSAALDALIDAQGEYPIVLVNGVAVCVGDIDADAITAAVSALRNAG